MRKISIEEFRAELAAQGVSGREHGAFKCVACGTVQSMAVSGISVESVIGKPLVL